MSICMRKLALAVAAVFSVGTAAHAADMVVKARPVVAPVPHIYNWTGFFVGVHVGYQSGSVINECPGGCPDHKISSMFGGVQGGYNYQLANNLVLGVWATIPIVSTHSDLVTIAGNFPAELRWAAAAGGRVGYAVGRYLPFVFAGGVIGGGRAGSPFAGSEDKQHTGFTVGGGFEYAINSNWSTALRYAYVEMSKEAYSIFPGERFGYRTNTIALGLNYRFGGPAVVEYLN